MINLFIMKGLHLSTFKRDASSLFSNIPPIVGFAVFEILISKYEICKTMCICWSHQLNYLHLVFSACGCWHWTCFRIIKELEVRSSEKRGIVVRDRDWGWELHVDNKERRRRWMSVYEDSKWILLDTCNNLIRSHKQLVYINYYPKFLVSRVVDKVWTRDTYQSF